VGKVAADTLAILAGRWLGRSLPAKAIKYGAAALFAVVGIWLLVDAIRRLT
jgi:putative Ca2+/H+ antiporter (TMEM165/GDT1 family)